MIRRILVASVARSDFSITRPIIEKLIQAEIYVVSKIISTTKYLYEDNKIECKVFNENDFIISNNFFVKR